MKRHNKPDLTLNHKSALKLSIVISLLLVLFMSIGLIFSGKDAHLIERGSIYNAIIQYITSVSVLFLLYEFCFWVFRKKWERHKKRLKLIF